LSLTLQSHIFTRMIGYEATWIGGIKYCISLQIYVASDSVVWLHPIWCAQCNKLYLEVIFFTLESTVMNCPFHMVKLVNNLALFSSCGSTCCFHYDPKAYMGSFIL
jgi:hypothetical protein